jgi:hypothetical protein
MNGTPGYEDIGMLLEMIGALTSPTSPPPPATAPSSDPPGSHPSFEGGVVEIHFI